MFTVGQVLGQWAIANTVLAKGGNVTGLMPKALVEKEVGLTKLIDFRIVDSMHERKAMMADLFDAFIALPGGFGTIEEIFEVLTWGQLEFHQKPIEPLHQLSALKKMPTIFELSFQHLANPQKNRLHPYILQNLLQENT